VYHPDFILELKKRVYTVIYSGDDPESSYFRSKPYLYAFDHAFCYGVYHNEHQLMTEKFLEWGAKRADLRPHGCWSSSYDHSLDDGTIAKKERDIDIIFVGGAANRSRQDVLLKLKKTFGSKFHLYGNWGGVRGFCERFRKGYGFIPISKLPHMELLRLYGRSKIGINIHQSYGPCNLRLYDLPMNGVMQICDNLKGLSRIYRLGEEVIGYENIAEMHDQIRYYLAHDNERIRIAINGFKKAKEMYLFHTTFFKAMERIKQGMMEKAKTV
jgi:spore maturation protein CgeB